MTNSNGPKILILTISEILNFDFSKFKQLSSLKFTKNSKYRVSEIAKNDIFCPDIRQDKISWPGFLKAHFKKH